MGREIPLLGLSNKMDTDPPQPHSWGAGLWLPIGFHMIEDLKDPSGPILNVDYRFGGIGKFEYAISNETHLGARLLGYHESTHVGDEFVIAARRLYSEFDRINVSAEFWDAALALERVPEADRAGLRGLVGINGLWDPSGGFYSSDTSETRGRLIPRSKNNTEPYIGAEWISGRPLRVASMTEWAPFVSLDWRYKTILNYRKTSSGEREDRQGSLNALVGIWHTQQVATNRGRLEFYARYYHGVNPAGQFRSQRNYTLYGLGLQMGY